MCRQCRLEKKHGAYFLALVDLYIYLIYIYSMGKGREIQLYWWHVDARSFYNRVSAYFWSTNLTITLLSWPLLFLEWGSRWHPSVSQASTSIPDSFQMFITVFFRSFSGMLFGMPNKCMLFLRLYCPKLWLIFLLKFIIFFSDMLFTFCVITSSLSRFLFSIEIWSTASVSSDVWSNSLCESVLTIT